MSARRLTVRIVFAIAALASLLAAGLGNWPKGP
jgi:hypothetical protein